ncbi:MAG: hypothetical protein ACYSVY_21820 [Planctomycetota bacterium]|jgi:elongation factor P
MIIWHCRADRTRDPDAEYGLMIKAIELRKGRTVLYEEALFVVHEATHVAKGNKGSYMQTKLKDLVKGGIRDVRFNVNDRLETPFLEDKEYEYLYREGDSFVFMDTTTYDQVSVSAGLVASQVPEVQGQHRCG